MWRSYRPNRVTTSPALRLITGRLNALPTMRQRGRGPVRIPTQAISRVYAHNKQYLIRVHMQKRLILIFFEVRTTVQGPSGELNGVSPTGSVDVLISGSQNVTQCGSSVTEVSNQVNRRSLGGPLITPVRLVMPPAGKLDADSHRESAA